MTEVWFRNPHNFIREMVECRAKNVAWDRGLLTKRRIDPYKHADVYFGSAGIEDWRALVVGDQGTAELRRGFDMDKPYAVYPTWMGHEPLELLEEMMAHPLGEDESAFGDMNIPPDQRPVEGQEHRVILTDIPAQNTGPGKALIRKVIELQEDYPECVVHVHGLYSYRIGFGVGFGSTDVDPRTNAGKGKVTLPTGKEMIAEKTIGCPQWVTLLGYNVVDLKEPRVRCMYNIKSALWAGENYDENVKFKTRGSETSDTKAKRAEPVKTTGYLSQAITPKQGDKIQCDTCSLQNACKYYRQGAVCSVPGSEPAKLSTYFNTRDSDKIITGLGALLGAQTERLQRGMADEDLYGELDPEVTKMSARIFDQGIKLAKLVDPSLSKPAVQVNVGNGGAGEIASSSPQKIMGAIVRELESRGIPRDQITPAMVENMLSEMTGGQKTIQGKVVDSDE